MSSVWAQSGSYSVDDLMVGSPISDASPPAMTPTYYYPDYPNDHYAVWAGTNMSGELGSGSEYFVVTETYIDDYYVTLELSLRHASDPTAEVDRVSLDPVWNAIGGQMYTSNSGHVVLQWGPKFYRLSQSAGVLSADEFTTTATVSLAYVNRAVNDITYDGSVVYYTEGIKTWSGFSNTIVAYSTADGSEVLSLDITAAMGSTVRLYEVIRLVNPDRIICMSYLNHYGLDPSGPTDPTFVLLDGSGAILDEIDATDVFSEGTYTSTLNISMRRFWRAVGASSIAYVNQDSAGYIRSRRLNSDGDVLSWERGETVFKPAWTRSNWQLAGWSTYCSYEDKILIYPQETSSGGARGYAVFYVLDTISGVRIRSERAASRIALSVSPRDAYAGSLTAAMVGQYYLFISPYYQGGS